MLMTETYAYTCAHHLPTFPDGHKCRRVHGHTCELTITVDVGSDPNGYAFDHAELDAVAAEVIGPLDHALVNEVPGLEDGLAESQLAWIVSRWQRHGRSHGELVAAHLDEWSSGGRFRLVKHRKSWTRSHPGADKGDPT